MNMEWIIPLGVNLKFVVNPSMSSNHQEGSKYFIKSKSGLSQYFKSINVYFYDGCEVDNQGVSITDNNLKGKQMVVKVFCPESAVRIEKSKEDYFYSQIKQGISEWIIRLIQSNKETKYSAKLVAFLYVYPM